MTDAQLPLQEEAPIVKKKACQISLMFPVDDDLKALQVKKAIDAIVGDIEHKRYTFNISEMD